MSQKKTATMDKEDLNARNLLNSYLLEIGIEEMPARVILPATEQLLKLAQVTLKEHRISGCHLRVFSTPRRLALLIEKLPAQQSDRTQKIKGPPKKIAQDSEGNWTRAALGFAKKQGLSPEFLTTELVDGKEYLFALIQETGEPLTQLLERHVSEWIHALSFPKNMRWGSGKMRCVRPIRWIVSLWNDRLLPVSLENLTASTETRGHRFLSPDPVAIPHALDYESILEAHQVIPDYEKRRSAIVSQVLELEKHFDLKIRVDLEESLLQEVTNLVETPTALLGHFDPNFLELPSQVLVTSMAVHQRYFPVYYSKKNEEGGSENSKLLPYFVTVRNGGNHALNTVREGNERVLRARLSDARFFYQDDQKHSLDYFCEKTKHVVFFQERGSIAQRVQRLKELSAFIAQELGLTTSQTQTSLRIAELCKFDLQTQMVKEFAELQGIMGGCYAKLSQESEVVGRGIAEHYAPKNAKDALPQDCETLPVALAEKLDLLVVAFSKGLIPSGSADPYALRRAAQGIVHIILEKSLPLSFSVVAAEALKLLCNQLELQVDVTTLEAQLTDFLQQRQRFFMKEQCIRYDLVNAVLASKELLPYQQWNAAKLLQSECDTQLFKSVVEAMVRASNIAQKNADFLATQDSEKNQIQEDKLVLSEEIALYQSLKTIVKLPLDLSHYLEQLQTLEPKISQFFDQVLVMDEDLQKRRNRLLLCQQLSQWSGRYLDLGELIKASS